jgi:hypothetical protein
VDGGDDQMLPFADALSQHRRIGDAISKIVSDEEYH